MSEGHPLTRALIEAAHGHFPPADGKLDVLPGFEGVAAVVVAFSGHNMIATSLPEAEVLALLPGDDVGAAMNPGFLARLAERLEARTYTPDMVMSTFRALPATGFHLVERPDLLSHPRAVMAQRYRRGVRTFADAEDRGLVTIGRSLLGVLEVSVEVKPAERSKGVGRSLALAARSLVPDGEPLLAGVSPGNAASVRAFLAAGYVPICSLIGMLEGAMSEAGGGWD